MKRINFLLVKKLTTDVERQVFSKVFLKTVLFMVWIRSRNRNRKLPKVGTGTVTDILYCQYLFRILILPCKVILGPDPTLTPGFKFF
jgi:hypothetical protein